MIRFIVFDVTVPHLEPNILRSGACNNATFNMQALRGNEAALEISAEQWPVNDTKWFVDLSGDEPVLSALP